MKKFLSLVFFGFALLSFASFANAQDLLTYNLRQGMKNDGQVAIMQNLLISQGYLASGNNTGNFGPLTFKAVKTYQSENSIDNTGFVGPKTRASMNAAIGGGSSMATLLPGCTSFSGYSATTGQSCAVAQTGPVTVTPVQVSNITTNSATLASSFTALSTGYYTVRFEYATDPNIFAGGTQSRIGQLILSGNGGSFSASMTNLIPYQTYYVRAIVEGGAAGTVSSSVASFTLGGSYTSTNTNTGTTTYQNQSTASANQPLVSTNSAISITDTSALLSGIYDGRGSATTVSFQYWYGLSSMNTTTTVQGGSGTGTASVTLSGLTPGMTYSYRLVAANGYGTVYGSTMTFTTTQPVNNSGYVYYSNGTSNTCAGSIPNLAPSLDSTSASGTILANQNNVPVITMKIGTDCDASLKAVTFTANPNTLLSTLSNLAVYLNGSSTATAGTFSGSTFTLATPIVMNAGTYTKVTLKVSTGSSTVGTVQFGVSNILAQSSSGIVNQYPTSVSGNTLSYGYTQAPPPNPGTIIISGTGGTSNNNNNGNVVQ